jgi:hypothetical protein
LATEFFFDATLWKKQPIGPVRLTAFSRTDCFQQAVQEHCLAFLAGFRYR